MMIRADNSVVRGIGFRRYSPSVPHMGAVTVERPGVTVENVAVTDMATTGLHVVGLNVTLRNVYAARNGMLGLNAVYSDGIVVDHVIAERNNVEHFNMSPVSGGMKIGRSRRITIRDSVFRDNYGPGFWADESTYDLKVLGSESRNNAGHGIVVEISAKALLADNVVTGNAKNGMKINDVSDVQIWNNTLTGNGRNINFVQDARRYSQTTKQAGSDPRNFPDPTMTWINGPAMFANNIIANPNSAGNCLICVEDYSSTYSAEQMLVTTNGNAYNRPSTTSPKYFGIWSTGTSNPAVFYDLATFRSGTGQESSGVLVTGSPIVDANGVPTSALPSSSGALPLPSGVATLIGQPAGAQHLGVF
jgi:hypothetical protein